MSPAPAIKPEPRDPSDAIIVRPTPLTEVVSPSRRAQDEALSAFLVQLAHKGEQGLILSPPTWRDHFSQRGWPDDDGVGRIPRFRLYGGRWAHGSRPRHANSTPSQVQRTASIDNIKTPIRQTLVHRQAGDLPKCAEPTLSKSDSDSARPGGPPVTAPDPGRCVGTPASPRCRLESCRRWGASRAHRSLRSRWRVRRCSRLQASATM